MNLLKNPNLFKSWKIKISVDTLYLHHACWSQYIIYPTQEAYSDIEFGGGGHFWDNGPSFCPFPILNRPNRPKNLYPFFRCSALTIIWVICTKISEGGGQCSLCSPWKRPCPTLCEIDWKENSRDLNIVGGSRLQLHQRGPELVQGRVANRGIFFNSGSFWVLKTTFLKFQHKIEHLKILKSPLLHKMVLTKGQCLKKYFLPLLQLHKT